MYALQLKAPNIRNHPNKMKIADVFMIESTNLISLNYVTINYIELQY